ncbi:small hydrophobic protein [Streptomyces sp. VRA16 Mangrove soil]|uniref:small hydrophobic protein n=1 Tax=Streptomyces sp. VRA16 Mangrove soil TaxID=2817434 RepID=UPI001A9FAE0E|nr:small hydrophobic protein [Streptomyces sp. VRA16 Mangrove soil]MBO1333077.1 small hydrophobic protein [Streptomyces sp. VRA16 Mangrove soil]
MMAGFGHTTRKRPRSRGRTWSRSGPDRASLGIIGLICAIAGFFVLQIVLGPAAVVCGWLAMGRRWTGTQSMPALVAVVLGAIDTLLAIVWLASGIGATAGGMF